jgi:hypothetical protein
MSSLLLSLSFVFLAVLNPAQAEDFRPDVPPFYSSLADVEASMEGRCASMEVRELDLLLDVARERQQQIDCRGFDYRGAPRFMELMFSDGELDLVIVLIEEEEFEDLATRFRNTYGQITHESPIGLFFYFDAVAIRTRPHEVVFTSKRTRANYQLYMDQMAREAAGE